MLQSRDLWRNSLFTRPAGSVVIKGLSAIDRLPAEVLGALRVAPSCGPGNGRNCSPPEANTWGRGEKIALSRSKLLLPRKLWQKWRGEKIACQCLGFAGSFAHDLFKARTFDDEIDALTSRRLKTSFVQGRLLDRGSIRPSCERTNARSFRSRDNGRGLYNMVSRNRLRDEPSHERNPPQAVVAAGLGAIVKNCSLFRPFYRLRLANRDLPQHERVGARQGDSNRG